MARQTDARRRMAFLEALRQREENGGERPEEAWKLTPAQKAEAAKFIRGLRLRCGMTQDQFGGLYGAVKRTVIRWEKGEYMPPKRTLDKMRAAGREKNMKDIAL